MKALCFLFAILAVSWANTTPPPEPLVRISTTTQQQPKNKSCIEHCNCKHILPNILQVVGCEAPLTINATTFQGLNKNIITVISFGNVIIQKIAEDAFKGFPVLEDVIIEKSKIGTVGAKAFTSVKKVKFSECGFEDSPDLFSEKLEELHFGSCYLDAVPALDELYALTFLNLSGNYIKDIDIITFAELFDLEELILSNNEIVKLPANLFINNNELNSLYLDNNPLRYFYMNTSNNLETLSLKNCKLTTFDQRSTYKLEMLNELNLSNNKITSISGKDFAYMKQLSVLDISNNSLTGLDKDVFIGNPELQKVILDGNKLKTLPSFTLNNTDSFKIYTMSCNYCGLKTLDKATFKNMPVIINLQLAQNNFTKVENMFDYIPSLRILDISNNQIYEIGPKAFASNNNLENLNLAGNPLMALNPEIFANNLVLKKIDASNTKLYKLWTSNSTILTSLKTLIVANNHLTTLSVEDLKVVPNLQAIDLHNNPLQFDEALCKVINWLERLSIYPMEYPEALETLEESFADDIYDDNMKNTWSEFHDKKCPEPLNEIEETDESEEDNIDNDTSYKLNSPPFSTDDYDDDYYNDEYDEDDGDKITAEVVEDENINLARASYILSVTSVFVLTALIVLTLAVTITLCILRRNSNFNMRNANLPRLKIPLWDAQPGHKKHSGSVYRPLSEDLSGPKTPKLSRYEFAATPTVHSTNP